MQLTVQHTVGEEELPQPGRRHPRHLPDHLDENRHIAHALVAFTMAPGAADLLRVPLAPWAGFAA